jgi:hypothetical protein
MIFIAGVSSLFVGLVLVIGPPGIRKLLFVASTIFGLTFWFFVDKNNRDIETLRLASRAKETEAAMRIRPEDVHLDSVKPINISYGAYELDGVVTNKSKFVLSGIYFRVAVTDCIDPNSCSVVGERDTLVSVAVLPNETKSFKGAPVAFTNLPASPQIRSASFKLIGTRAEF